MKTNYVPAEIHLVGARPGQGFNNERYLRAC